jgi:trehalose 6-phosphate synthase
VQREGAAEACRASASVPSAARCGHRRFPIGIDVDDFRVMCRAPEAVATFEHMRDEYAKRRLLVGVDRLDYSKGCRSACRPSTSCWHATREPQQRHADPGRVAVARVGRRLCGDPRGTGALCGSINGEFGELDWMPVRYLHRTIARRRLPGLYQASCVALVTPLRDGMNLVAKEFIAAQDETTRRAGAVALRRRGRAAARGRARQSVRHPATADAIQRALRMPREERVRRHQALLETIRRQDVKWWRSAYLDALREVEAPREAAAA